MKANMVGWLEIPVTDMVRAKNFYETVFDVKIQIQDFEGTVMGWFPFSEDPEAIGAGGSLVLNENFYKPSSNGTLVYFSSAEITIELSKVEGDGGVVLQEKTLITDDIGFRAFGFRRKSSRASFKRIVLI